MTISRALPYDAIPPRPANASTPCVALAVDFGAVSGTTRPPTITSTSTDPLSTAGQAVEDFVMISYDDIYSIDWFGLPLEAYWKQLLGNMSTTSAVLRIHRPPVPLPVDASSPPITVVQPKRLHITRKSTTDLWESAKPGTRRS